MSFSIMRPYDFPINLANVPRVIHESSNLMNLDPKNIQNEIEKNDLKIALKMGDGWFIAHMVKKYNVFIPKKWHVYHFEYNIYPIFHMFKEYIEREFGLSN